MPKPTVPGRRRTEPAESVRDLSVWSCVTTWPEVSATPVGGDPSSSRERRSCSGSSFNVLEARTDNEFETVFANVVQLRAGGLVISGDPYFNSRSERLAALAMHHGVPAVYQFHEFAAAGGLISYGSSLTDTHRLAGVYTGRVLRGEKPAYAQGTVMQIQQQNRISAFTMFGNWARTIFLFGVSSWHRRSVRCPGRTQPRRTAR
jgi:hypothetical protein